MSDFTANGVGGGVGGNSRPSSGGGGTPQTLNAENSVQYYKSALELKNQTVNDLIREATQRDKKLQDTKINLNIALKEIADLRRSKEHLQADVNQTFTLKEQLGNANASHHKALQKVVETSKMITALKEEIGHLKEQVSQMETLKQKLATTELREAGLKTQYDGVYATVGAFQTELVKLRQQNSVADMQAKQDLTLKQNLWEGERQALQAQINQLNSTVGQLQTANRVKDQTIAQLQSSVDSMKKSMAETAAAAAAASSSSSSSTQGQPSNQNQNQNQFVFGVTVSATTTTTTSSSPSSSSVSLLSMPNESTPLPPPPPPPYSLLVPDDGIVFSTPTTIIVPPPSSSSSSIVAMDGNEEDEDEECMVVGIKGSLPEHFVHPRCDCTSKGMKFPDFGGFKPSPLPAFMKYGPGVYVPSRCPTPEEITQCERNCPKCFCYVCDTSVSECPHWSVDKGAHCLAYNMKGDLDVPRNMWKGLCKKLIHHTVAYFHFYTGLIHAPTKWGIDTRNIMLNLMKDGYSRALRENDQAVLTHSKIKTIKTDNLVSLSSWVCECLSNILTTLGEGNFCLEERRKVQPQQPSPSSSSFSTPSSVAASSSSSSSPATTLNTLATATSATTTPLSQSTTVSTTASKSLSSSVPVSLLSSTPLVPELESRMKTYVTHGGIAHLIRELASGGIFRSVDSSGLLQLIADIQASKNPHAISCLKRIHEVLVKYNQHEQEHGSRDRLKKHQRDVIVAGLLLMGMLCQRTEPHMTRQEAYNGWWLRTLTTIPKDLLKKKAFAKDLGILKRAMERDHTNRTTTLQFALPLKDPPTNRDSADTDDDDDDDDDERSGCSVDENDSTHEDHHHHHHDDDDSDNDSDECPESDSQTDASASDEDDDDDDDGDIHVSLQTQPDNWDPADTRTTTTKSAPQPQKLSDIVRKRSLSSTSSSSKGKEREKQPVNKKQKRK